MDNARQLLISIVVGNTIVNITTASIAAILTFRLCAALGFPEKIGILLDIIVVTFVLLVTSEILPKVIAVRKPAPFARKASGLLNFFYYIFYPISFPLARFTSLLQNQMGLRREKALLSEEELKTLADVGEEHGALQKDEKEMIHSIFEFGETMVKEIMVPRTDMVCVNINTPINQLMQIVRKKLHSRIPVYEDRIDNILGILYVKDLLPFITSRTKEKIKLQKLTRPAYFVPEQKKIDELLREFQKERIHIALVVDEYGGIAGLVTLEDIIEEIVGEIQDEYDKELPLYKELEDGSYIVNGRMPLEEINEELHLNLPTEEGVETISGFILSLLGSLPTAHELVEYDGYRFVVEEVAKNRILKVRIQKNNPDVKTDNEIAN